MVATASAHNPASPAYAEAARYALLRRLAPSMRHHLVVNLQPIGMIYEVMDRRLRAPQPDLANVHDGAHKINGFARAALNSCLDVVTWLAPDEAAVSTAEEGAKECVGLLATSLSFRGYALRNGIEGVPGEVRRTSVRNVLTAALIQATDELPPPAELRLAAEPSAAGLRIELSLDRMDADHGFASEPTYRTLEWSDVQALAAAEGVELSRRPGERVLMIFPWARAGRA